MKKTLYDLLGVRRDASRIEIEKAYDRIKAVYGGADGPELAARDGCSIHLIEEAFATLANPAKREAYEASLQRAAQRELASRSASSMESEPAPLPTRLNVAAALALVALVFGGWIWKSSHDAQVEAERRMELRRIEVARLAAEAEAERLRAENDQAAMRRAAEEQQAARDLQAYAARYGAVRAQAEYLEQRRQENERRQEEQERRRQEMMERQARDREKYEQRRREAEDRRYLDQFKPGMSFGK